MKTKTKTWLITIIIIVLASNLPPVNYFFQEDYSYKNKDGSFRYTEKPGKELDFKVAKLDLIDLKQLTKKTHT